MITPKNIVHHELIGLNAKVVESSNPSQVGILGRVVDETRNTLVFEDELKRIKRIAKDSCKFLFEVEDVLVKVKGELLVARPEDRMSKKHR